VTICLNIQSDEVIRLYKEWQQLKGLHDLNQIYEERKSDLAEFHEAYKLMKDEGISPRQLVDAAYCLKQISLLEPRLKNIKHDIQSKENQKQQQMNELSLIRNDITLARQEVDSYVPIINTNKEVIAKLSHHVQELESLIARLKNAGEYRRVEKVAEMAARKILADNKMILEIALGAVRQTLKDDPDLQLVISGSLRDPTYGPRSDSAIRNYVILYNTKILEMSGQIFNILLEKCVNNTMFSALNMT
jgi:chromosome segregation ATPase